MKNKNLPNRLTNSRLVMSIIIIIILVFPFDMINVSFKKFLVNDTLIMDTRMIIVGVLFILSSITDFLDGDRKSTRLNSSHTQKTRMPSSA